ncbi:MAG: hypothetical protein JMN24_01760 [gamma proteobacterium endosymbiont of Lamellibrachia anaximandri]|nr:hypothetical protein [gamma proteobacterium endosymbiont of Lamellibrachia anaximandri]MBL3616384.1 hypothetical protein [gamma proteobacterium endosymbiont of Lamellibrachia anaximandri]
MQKKIHVVSRDELYDLVWQQPRTHLAKHFGISDVAIGKACRKANIPMPPAGYWARKRSGKSVLERALPPREPGVDNEIIFGGSRYAYRWVMSDQEVLEQTPGHLYSLNHLMLSANE